MRKVVLVAIVSGMAGFAAPAHADPYRWCAEYSGRGLGGSSNCYFMTIQQCRAAIAGVGGFCRRNTFYTGSDRKAPRRRR